MREHRTKISKKTKAEVLCKRIRNTVSPLHSCC